MSRTSPVPNQIGNRVSSVLGERRMSSGSDRDRGESSVSTIRRHHDDRYAKKETRDDTRGSRDNGGYVRHCYTINLVNEYERGSIYDRRRAIDSHA